MAVREVLVWLQMPPRVAAAGIRAVVYRQLIILLKLFKKKKHIIIGKQIYLKYDR